ncbi:MAG: hypothetical protein II154_01235 [Lachnospiraceae bacterium]|nr:hypothetical protein [Lachnospiraceae bacterium]
MYGFFEDREKASAAIASVRAAGLASDDESFVTGLITPDYSGC